MVLAAGKGTRLGIASDVPKPMISLGGKPILEHTLEWLRRSGVSDVVINLHHQRDRIRDHFGDGSRLGMRITYSVEEALLGTAGALVPVRDQFTSTFLLVYGDNYYRCDVGRFVDAHRRHGGIATMALHERADVSQSGVARMEEDGRIVEFVEKPANPDACGRMVNAGLILLEPSVFRYFPARLPADFSRDVIPSAVAGGERLYGYALTEPEGILWIDRPEDLASAQRAVLERLEAR